MKRLKFKVTSKNTKFENFSELSNSNLDLIRGGNAETPPGEDEYGNPING
jgi:hypothetical protein